MTEKKSRRFTEGIELSRIISLKNSKDLAIQPFKNAGTNGWMCTKNILRTFSSGTNLYVTFSNNYIRFQHGKDNLTERL